MKKMLKRKTVDTLRERERESYTLKKRGVCK